MMFTLVLILVTLIPTGLLVAWWVAEAFADHGHEFPGPDHGPRRHAHSH